MNKYDYDLTFNEVINEIFKTKGWYQGENFKDGYFISVNENNDDMIYLYYFSENKCGKHTDGCPVLSKGLFTQKYRRIYTEPSAKRIV